MILVRQENQQEIESKGYPNKLFKSPGFSYDSSPHRQNSKDMKIFPCCYQITCHKNTPSLNGQVQTHSCFLTGKQSIENDILAVDLSQNTSVFTKVKRPHQGSSFFCSFCQKSNLSGNFTRYIKCLNCQKQFCEKCSLLLHGKGKFMSHQLVKVDLDNHGQKLTQQGIFFCSTHHKSRRFLLRDKIVCETCYRQQTGKLPPHQTEDIDSSLVEENIKFSNQYFNQIYHNQANKLSELKQNLNQLHKNCIQKLEQKHRYNLSQILKIQNNIKHTFSQNISQLTNMNVEIQIISNSKQILSNFINKDLLQLRLSIIQQKLFQLQFKCQDFITQSCYDYKIGDKDKNQVLIQQFLKTMSIIKVKRQQEDGMCTNRSSYRNNLKTSRTVSRPSSNRPTNSKDNRCASSFKKNQSMSSSKQNSSFKQKDRNLIMKSYLNTESNKKNEDLTSSVTGMSRNSMGKYISKNSSVQPSANTSRNNSTFFKQKEKNCNVKELQKAEYQDLNLNLRKLIVTKKSSQVNNQTKCSQKPSQAPSQSTSLEKKNNESQKVQTKKTILTKQNQKSTINSGSFLKIFDQKNRSAARKNYLVSSGEELQDLETKHKIDIKTTNINLSPQNSSQLKKKKIKNEIFGSNHGSSSNKFSEVTVYDKYTPNDSAGVKSQRSKNQQQSGLFRQIQKSQNKSAIFDNLIAVSCERKQTSQISEFNYKSQDGRDINLNNSEMIKTQISEFSCSLGRESSQLLSQNLKDIHMTTSINILENNQKQKLSNKKQRTKVPSILKIPQKKQTSSYRNQQVLRQSSEQQSPQLYQKIFKDCTNVVKPQIKQAQQTQVGLNQKQNKKRPDFMDMRQRMRKPNYLSSKLGSNLNGGGSKIGDARK